MTPEKMAKSKRFMTKLQKMYQEWPFFRAMLSNTQMALFKAELKIAKEYSKLCKNPEVGNRIYDQIRDEYNRTITQVLNVTGNQTLLQDNSTLALSLSRNFPPGWHACDTASCTGES